ncbi:MAG: NAD(P)-binding domain-containing protein [Bacteroidia bacterium]|nr:NAD(P)-binding domain-containing protein [Bacteroidia bacterium]
MKKKIGILGSGIVAKTLGAGFLKYGYEVMLGTRDVSKLTEWQAGAGKGAKTGSFAETAAFGEIIVLAVGGTVAREVLETVGADHLNGKTVIDATNPIAKAPPVNGVMKFFTTLDESLMEILQNAFPGAHFVKSFSCVGSAFMVDPRFESKPTMFICGNNDQAKAEVSAILDQFGWEISDMGKVEGARAIEPLCMLWCIPGMLRGEWSHAFRLMKA